MQHSALRFSNVVVDSPALILLRHGTKLLQSGGRRWTLQSGDAIAVAGGQAFDVSNRLSAAGLYEARWLMWDKALIERFMQTAPAGRPLSGAMVLKQVSTEFVATADRAVAAISDPSGLAEDVARHRLAELLVWLSVAGIQFTTAQTTTATSQLRRLFAESAAEAWTMPRVAARLAMSEATLRRRLHSEGTSFGNLLADVRMSHAMTLLQSTDHPVAHIALKVGYESASRFAIRFRERFGFAPTAIRGHRRARA
ncbi:helix-turn-helix transcriptional regulator [Aquabacterium sp. A7-Y]|uniref:helix-turn-helix transcriptional regulator n=1 Tax=Aquabacterium sp. A7-Y TaxID=1349605 RepID=UPI00223E7D24|nr:helix-turn-helix transcriptional regulator [Aquabacterium sp. A7-Y]MCW7541774.1 helix-turn-helix transcriptional regulator [Aquabacterium sp. A7-Y]